MEQLINFQAGTFPKTLNGAITSTSSTSVTLLDVTGLPTSGTCRIKIDDEYLIATLTGSATITVTRGAEGSTAATHLTAAPVSFPLTSGALDGFRVDNCGYGPTSSRPAAGKNGRIYLNNDSQLLARDNGTTWDLFFENRLVTPPNISGFTGYGTAATGSPLLLTRSKGDCTFCYFNSTVSGDSSHCGAFCTVITPSTTWQAIFGSIPSHSQADQILLGMTLLESSTGKCLFFGYQFEEATPDVALSANFRTLSSGGSSFASDTFNTSFRNPALLKYLQMYYDNANARVNLSISADGIDWAKCGHIDFSGNFTGTPDMVGFGISPPVQIAAGSGMTIFDWDLQFGI